MNDAATADPARHPLCADRIPADVFDAMRRENLARWPTGAEVDLDEAVARHKAMPREKQLGWVMRQAAADGRCLTQPRGGYGTFDLQLELMHQLDGRGVVLKQGTLIDATIVRAQARRPRMKEEPISAVDPDARFGTNNERRRYQFGYKLHAAVDRGSGLVRALRVTPANVQEVVVAGELVQGDEQAVYADRGYDAKHLHDHLAAAGIADGVMRRGRKNTPLSPDQLARNRELSLARRPVEKLFGTLKRSYRLDRVPYYNLARNTVALGLACFAFNLRRLQALATP